MNTSRRAALRLIRFFTIIGLLILSISILPATTLADSPEQQLPQDDEGAPYTASLIKSFEDQQAQGLPVPTYTVERNIEQATSSNLKKSTTDPDANVLKKTSTITIYYEGPEQAGYEEWPSLNDSAGKYGDADVDFNQIFEDQLAVDYPLFGNVEVEDLAHQPRTIVITETIEYADGELPENVNKLLESKDIVVQNPNSNVTKQATNPTTTQDDILMGFTYIGPQIWYGIEYEISTSIPYPTFTNCEWYEPWNCTVIWQNAIVEALYVKMGVQLAWGLGMRLPGQVSLSGFSNAEVGDDVTLTTRLKTGFPTGGSDTDPTWEADDYHDYGIWIEESRCDVSNPPSSCDHEGSEYVTFLTAFAGIKLRIAGVDICAFLPSFWCGLDIDESTTNDFTTPLGTGASGTFTIDSWIIPFIELPPPADPNDKPPAKCQQEEHKDDKECKKPGDSPFKFTASITLTPGIGGNEVLADWRATANCASGQYLRTGTTSYKSFAAGNPNGVDIAGTNIQLNDLCNDTTVRLSNFRYKLTNFALTIGIQLKPEVTGFPIIEDTFTQDIPLYTADLSQIFSGTDLQLGDHMYCTSDIQNGPFNCERAGPSNQLTHKIDIQVCDSPAIEHTLTGTKGEGNYFNSTVSARLSATGVGPGCSIRVFYEPWWWTYVPAIDKFFYNTFNNPDIPTPYNPPVNFIYNTEGAYEFIYWGDPNDGPNTPSTRVKFVIDKTAPSITPVYRSPDFNGWYNDDLRVWFAANDPNIETYVPFTSVLDDIFNFITGNQNKHIQSGSGVAFITPPQTLSEDGTDVTIPALVRDRAGNVRNILAGPFKIDQTAPVINYEIMPGFNPTPDTNGDLWINQQIIVDTVNNMDIEGVKVEFTPTDATSGVASSEVDDVIITGEGRNFIASAKATDNAGNEEEITVTGINIDLTPPTLTADVPPPNIYGWYNGDVPVQFIATDPKLEPSCDANSGAGCNDNGSGIESLTADDSANNVEGASQSLTAIAKDFAGNISTLTVTVNIDSTPPISDHILAGTLGGNNWYTTDVTLTINSFDPGIEPSGIRLIEHSFDGGVTWIENTGPLVFDDGIYTVHYRATDFADNVEQPKMVSFKVDTTPPAILGERTPLPNASGWNTTPVTVQFTASDTGSGLASLNPTNVVVSAEGANQAVVAIAFDNAGNSASLSIDPINIDMLPPESMHTLQGTLENNVYVTEVNLSLTAVDPGTSSSGVNIIQFSYDGQVWQNYTQPLVFGDGSHTVYYRAGDTANNVEQPNMVAFNVAIEPDDGGNGGGGEVDPPVVTCLSLNFEGLSAGTVVTEQFEGISISTSGISAMIFDSANPTGQDPDLGAPNESYGGPGIGAGGASNTQPQGMVLIISEDGDSSDPDDKTNGGTLSFQFDVAQTIANVSVLDVEEVGGMIRVYGTGGLLKEVGIPALADNSFQTVAVDAEAVTRMDVYFTGSAAVTYVDCGDNSILAVGIPSAPVAIVEPVDTSDTTAPQSSHSLDGTTDESGEYTSNVTVTLSASDPDPNPSGVDRIQYSTDGQNWTLYTDALGYSDGVHTIYYRAIDVAGNIEDTKSVNFQIDTTPPEIASAPVEEEQEVESQSVESNPVVAIVPTETENTEVPPTENPPVETVEEPAAENPPAETVEEPTTETSEEPEHTEEVDDDESTDDPEPPVEETLSEGDGETSASDEETPVEESSDSGD